MLKADLSIYGFFASKGRLFIKGEMVDISLEFII